MIVAISWYFRPSISFSTSGIRNSAGSRAERALHSGAPFLGLESVRRSRVGMTVGGIASGLVAGGVDRSGFVPRPSPLGGRRVESDAEQPGVESRLPAKRLEPLKRLHKGVLCDVPRIFGRAQDAGKRVEKAVLVADHQFPECLRPACQALADELFLVAGHVSHERGWRRTALGQRKGRLPSVSRGLARRSIIVPVVHRPVKRRVVIPFGQNFRRNKKPAVSSGLRH